RAGAARGGATGVGGGDGRAEPAPSKRAPAAAPPAPSGPLLTPQQLSSQLRRAPDVMKIRPSRSIPAIFVLLVVIAIATSWVMLFRSP
ncbi:MAG TPA: hypothetical protein VK601_04905, partial [Kofleriaceae bacterium]|nr:hypothetical protein [Kofleriaceae bacterium]